MLSGPTFQVVQGLSKSIAKSEGVENGGKTNERDCPSIRQALYLARTATAPSDYMDQEEAPSILATVDTFSCWNCTGVFSSWDLLEKHRKTAHGELEPRHRCSLCPYTSDYKYKVVAHERTHTGQKPFVCATCDRSFALQDSLTRHTRIHTGERPHVCATCGQTFAVLGNLRTHERTHTGERPYVCPQCGKGFGKKSDMTRHARIHNRV